MGQIIKTYLGMFMILFLTVTAIGILSAFVTVMNAQDEHARIIQEIEDSNYAPSVVQANFLLAEKDGYELTLTAPDDTGSQVRYTRGEEITEDLYQKDWVRVDLRFTFRISFFGIRQSHVLSGYAR